MTPKRPVLVPVFFVLALLIALPAHAYLSIVRQGDESAGAPEAGDHFGERVVTGDFDGDGFDDLATAAPNENNGGNPGDHGSVIISYGSTRGIVHTGATTVSIGSPADFAVYFGRGLAVGNFNNDPYDDLAVGAPGAQVLATDDAGLVFIYHGSASGLNTTAAEILDQADLNGAVEAGDQLGYTLAAGNFNGDNYDDLAIGSIGEDSDAGAIFHVYGSAGGIDPTTGGFMKQSALGSTNEAGSRFGFALATGNLVGSSHDDLVVSAPFRLVNSLPGSGQVTIIRGSAGGLTTIGSQIITAASLGIDQQDNSWFGYSLAAGTMFDPNDEDDLAIGQPAYDYPGQVSAGRVIVLEFESVPFKGVAPPLIIDQSTAGEQIQAADGFGWSMTVGDWNGDPYADLLVGSPFEARALAEVIISEVGMIHAFAGSPNGPDGNIVYNYDPRELSDLYTVGGNMGKSIALGAFDGSGKMNIAVGAPDEDYAAWTNVDTAHNEAGQVYIIAQHRQPVDLPHRGSVARDCLGGLVHAQRPFQKLNMASTAKAMTALVACEALENGDIQPDFEYTVPDWVAHEIHGSKLGLFEGEKIEFIDLLRTMIAVSGNDCAAAIAVILTSDPGNYDDPVANFAPFAALMDAKAAELGMTDSNFKSPIGDYLDGSYDDSYTTPWDMTTLARAALQDESYREIVGTPTWFDVHRRIPINIIFPWVPSSFLIDVYVDVGNGFLQGAVQEDADAIGVKGGNNKAARITGIFAANKGFGRATATAYGVPNTPPGYGDLGDLGGRLMGLLDSSCEPVQVLPLPVPHPFPVAFAKYDIPTDDGLSVGVMAEIDEPGMGDLMLDVVRRTNTAATVNLQAVLSRDSQVAIEPGESAEFGLDPMEEHLGLRIRNEGTTTATIQVDLTHPLSSNTYVLAPDQTVDIAPYAPPATKRDGSLARRMRFRMTVVNISSVDAATLSVSELGYRLDLTLGDGITMPGSFMAELARDGDFDHDVVRLHTLGEDLGGGELVAAVLHHRTTAVGVPEDGHAPISATRTVSLQENYPNPFNPQTTLRFSLERAGHVELSIYDTAGRKVKTLLDGPMGAGTHDIRWNGRDDRARGVSSGIYYSRLTAHGQIQARPMALVR